MLRTEIDVLKTIGFDLGIPLSYRFLRRYAKVSVCCVIEIHVYRYRILLWNISLPIFVYRKDCAQNYSGVVLLKVY